VTPPPGVEAGDVAWPAPVERRLAFGGDKPLLLYEKIVTLSVPLSGTPTSGRTLRASLRYQACDDTRCLPPRTLDLSAEIVDAAGGDGPTGGASDGRIEHWVARWGWGITFVLVALLGAALNLTPCVYPLISVTVALFGGQTAGGEQHTLRRALLYVLGICLSFSTLGMAAALTGSLFGAALQRPAVPVGIALVLIGLAASNFGLWQVRAPAAVTARLGGASEGDLGAMLMGLTMGLVAAPCIGPIVVGLLLFVGARGSAALGFGLFFALGLGMGAPYVGLAALAGRLRRLPRAGEWLLWMEHLFGFLLLGLALYFVAPLLPGVVVRAAVGLLVAAAGVVLGLLGAARSGSFRIARFTGGVAAVALGVALIVEGLPGAAIGAGVAWNEFSDQALAQAAAKGRPAFVDFQAEWCLPCREMEFTTFRDPTVVGLAAEFTTLRVDVTAADEAANEVMHRFKVLGVPTYILFGPDGRERRRFVGSVSAPELASAMREVLPASRG
jgi:thiol:disulfide interchange protein DsbD